MSAQPESKPEDRAVAMEKKVAELEQNWSRLKWAAGIIGVAVLIVTGYGFVDIPKRAIDAAEKKLTPIVQAAAQREAEKLITPELVKKANEAKERAKKAAEEAENARDRVADLEKQISAVVNKAPAARCLCLEKDTGKKIPVAKPGETKGLVINFAGIEFDTHAAVQPAKPGKDWRYVVPESGLYSVTAYACVVQGGKGGTSLTLDKKGKVAVFLAQLSMVPVVTDAKRKNVDATMFVDGTMIGGTAHVELAKDEEISIRVHAYGNTDDSRLIAARATWFSIHYVRSPLPKKKG